MHPKSDVGIMPVFCPTCQTIFLFIGIIKASTIFTVHGVVFDIFAAGLAARQGGLDHDMRERSRLLEEELRFKNEEESNRHLHSLSIVTSLLLPPTLVTGIFGMNTKGLPLTDVDQGFLWAAALMVCSVGLACLFMRRSGIFKT